MPENLMTVQNIIGAFMTGIMGLLWKDIRAFRKETETNIHDHKRETDIALYKKLDIDVHKLVCENATLKIREHLDERLDQMAEDRRRDIHQMKDEILVAIKKNGSGH